MMGDEMAVRSGGMYGNPESSYTYARPVSFGQSLGSSASFIGRIGKSLLSQYSAWEENEYNDKQIGLNLSALRAEKQYNLENFRQKMADTLAKNKISFYSSGLDINSGTPASVILSNQNAMLADYGMMERNYTTQEKSLENARKANDRKLAGDMVGSFLSIF